MALTSWSDILNKPKGVNNIEELALTVEQLSASVLSISEDVGELALDVSQLSATVLTIAGEIDDIKEVETLTFADYFTPVEGITLNYGIIKKVAPNIAFVSFGITATNFPVGQSSKVLNVSSLIKENMYSPGRMSGTTNPGAYAPCVGLLDTASQGFYTISNLVGTVFTTMFYAII